MTQERQDGWYWVRPWAIISNNYNTGWKPAYSCWADKRWLIGAISRDFHERDIIGSRIPSPDEPKAPDLLAVVAAAQEWRDAAEAHNASGIWTEARTQAWLRVQAAEVAIRSALAKLDAQTTKEQG